MKRFWIFIATFSLVEWIGRNPATAGFLMLLGISGGVGGIVTLITPAITPQQAASFNQTNAYGNTANGLMPNAGTPGALFLPSDPQLSAAEYFEGTVDPNLGYGASLEYPIGSLGLTGNAVPGQPAFVVAREYGGSAANQFWQAWSPASIGSIGGVSGASNYNTGLYPVTATNNGCVRPPSGVWTPSTGILQVTDPGFECPAAPSINFATIPGVGAQQATGPSASPAQSATTCAVVNGQAVVTAHIAVASGISPGMAYTMAGFTPTGYNSTTYTALQGTTDSPNPTLVGTTGATSCPGAVTVEGTALSGTGATFTFPAMTTTNIPWGSAAGTGVTTKTGQHICVMAGYNGDDSQFPGTAYISAVDDKGNALPGSPALAQNSNMASAKFTGYTIASSQVLTVTAMIPTTISGAVYNTGTNPNGTITFTTSAPSGINIGSQFTVSGMAPSSVNGTYVALAGTTGTTLVGNQLTGPAGVLQPLSNPGAITTATTPQVVSVILPGMQIFGGYSQTGIIILPYGALSTSGTGGAGTYALSFNQNTWTSAVNITTGGVMTTGNASFGNSFAVGQNISISSASYTGMITGYLTGIGQSGTYQVSPSPGTAITGSPTMTVGPLFSSSSPGTIFAFSGFFNTGVGVASSTNNALNHQSQSNIGDLFGPIGNNSSSITTTHSGWGGTLGNFAMLWGPQPMSTGGAPSTTALASLCKKTVTVPQYVAANSGMLLHSFYPLSDIGVFGDAGIAQVSGYITATSGATSGVLNLVGSPISGALTGSGTAILSGPGIPGCAGSTPACPTVTLGAGPTYAVTWASGIGQNVGSSGAPVAMAVGTYKPAVPIASNTVQGYIDGSPAATTLHVTGLPTSSGSATFTGTLGTQFTAKIDNGSGSAGNTLTVTSPTSAAGPSYIGVGTQVCPPIANPSAFTCATVTAQVTNTNTSLIGGQIGTYTLNGSAQLVASQTMYGLGILPGPPTALQVTTPTGTIQTGQYVTDGGASLTAQPLLIVGNLTTNVWQVAASYYQSISADAAMTASLSVIVPGEYIRNASLPNPVKVIGYGPGPGAASGPVGSGSLGTYTLSTGANGAVGSSGSPATFVGTTISDGGVIAAGPALTIKDQGAGIEFPIDPSTFSCSGLGACVGSGTLTLSGTYDVPTLGGTPSGIQVLVSDSANGAPLPGCTPCNWGTLTGTISGGAWSGSISGIPAGGPYSISVRAANGTAYATLPSTVKIGIVVDAWGQGQVGGILTAAGGTYWSYYTGLWGEATWHSPYGGNEFYLSGPPITGNFVPSQATAAAGDQFGITGSAQPALAEGIGFLEQNLGNASGFPVSLVSAWRDGVGIGPETLGNAAQTQSVGVGNGATTEWCSVAKFCSGAGGGTVGQGGPLTFNLASLTGSWFTGSVSGSTLTVTTWLGGAIEPGMVLSATGNPTLVNCLTNCPNASAIASGSTWALSSTTANGASGSMRVDPVGGAPWPNFNYQSGGTLPFGFGGFGWNLIQAGTFQILVNGTVACQDSNTFAYNQAGGNCTGAGIASSFVNYQTGDYQITFTTAPAANAVITASWTNIVSPEGEALGAAAQFSRPQGLDFFGNGTNPQSGPVSAVFQQAPGGSNVHLSGGCGTDESYLVQGLSTPNPPLVGYQYGSVGYTQMWSWLYNTRYPTIPGMKAQTPLATTLNWRNEGPAAFTYPAYQSLGACDQWGQDVVTKSTFSGMIASGVLTLSADAVGPAGMPMWEGEVIGPGAGNTSLASGTGIYITSLSPKSSAGWGKSGSTYNLAGASGVSASGAFINDVYYKGTAPTIYAGPQNDITNQASGLQITSSPHPGYGMDAGGRAGRRWASLIYGGLTSPANSSAPTVDRVAADASGCDTSAKADPCFDIGNTFAATASVSWTTGGLFTVTGGLAAHARPFVLGQSVNCSPACGSNLIITSVSLPPTQDTRTNQGQIGQTFTFQTAPKAGGSLPSSASSGAATAGCSGIAGTGSNCIDVAISINTTNGTFGTASAIDTCGENNLNGNAGNNASPNGACHGNGVGSLVRTFRIGTQQFMSGVAAGSLFDDGIDYVGGTFNQNAAYTCHIVAAKIMQCVHGPTQAAGVFALGQWASGNTFISEGDAAVVTGRIAGVMGYVGGQSFPFTAGSGYSPNATITETAACPTLASGGALPTFDVTVAGGSIVDVYPSATATTKGPQGLGVGSTCTVPLTGFSGGSGGAIATIQLGPIEGIGGVATYNTDSNMVGTFPYDNTGEPGNPLNLFFSNGMGGYFEPGNALRPFGSFQGLAVSG